MGGHVGYTVGGGLAIGLTDRISFNAEYRYSDLGEFSAPTGGAGLVTARTTIDTIHSARGAISFRY